MQQKQRYVIAITVPLIIIIATLGIAAKVPGSLGNPFDWKDTWHIWVVSIALILGFLCFLNRDQRNMVVFLVPISIVAGTLGIASEQRGAFGDPFNWGSTWYVWLVSIALISGFLYRILGSESD